MMQLRRCRPAPWPAMPLGTMGLCALLFAIAGPAALQAQDRADSRATYITPFPDNNTYTIYAIGDSLASGLYGGLRLELKPERDVRVVSAARDSGSLIRTRPVDRVERIRRLAGTAQIDIAVLTFGVNDRLSVRVDGKRYRPGSDIWARVYAARIDALLGELHRGKTAIYWLGLPVMRGSRTNAESQAMNAIARDRVSRAGGKFIDTSSSFADGSGRFTPYGPDLAGRVRRLRSKDGVYFTGRGYRKFAHFAARVIRRDLREARGGRSVLLAGSADELRPLRRLAGRDGTRSATQRGGADTSNATGQRNQVATIGVGEYKANNSTVRIRLPGATRKTFQVRILRPAIPAAVVAHIRRRSAASGGQSIGQGVLTISADGTPIISSITSSAAARAGRGGRNDVPVTQTPVYKALVKGEVLESRPGRTDDFTWPPKDRAPLPAAGL